MAIAPGKNAFNTKFDDDSLRLNVKGATLSNIYRRLNPDEPSYTVTGSGGGGTHMYHWSEPRALTNRERARLQTFPDNYRFYGTGPSVRRQIGMAVPPEGAQVVIEALLRTMDGVEYDSVAPSLDVDELIRSYELSESAIDVQGALELDGGVSLPRLGGLIRGDGEADSGPSGGIGAFRSSESRLAVMTPPGSLAMV